MKQREGGYTLVELIAAIIILAIITTSGFTIISALVRSAVVAKRQAAASTLATNQMEYLKSLPYDSLAIAGGPIVSSSPLPATTTKTINNIVYTIKSSIN